MRSVLSKHAPHPSSFRDPAGYVFAHQQVIKRAVTHAGAANYELYRSTGLHDRLTASQLVVDHVQEAVHPEDREHLHTILVPGQIPFISYPYEWCFDQLKDAALLTLRVQEESLARGMSLKDASAFNVQFTGARPVFIDLCSFEPDDQGPWVAYEQFCRHFLGPLLFMSHLDSAGSRFFRTDLEGFPIALISSLLPWKTWLQPDVLVHIHLHSRSRTGVGTAGASAGKGNSGRLKHNILSSLRAAIEKLEPSRSKSRWTEYVEQRSHYTEVALEWKGRVVRDLLAARQPKLVFDLGANTGDYSAEAGKGAYCVALDSDAGCVNAHYRRLRQNGERSILPLMMNLENPSPGIGFHSTERTGFLDRARADFGLALAVVHHLRITSRAPFAKIAALLATLTKASLVEFVPLEDPMAQQLLNGRAAEMDDYTLEGFQEAFGRHFELKHVSDLPGTHRSLWLAEARA